MFYGYNDAIATVDEFGFLYFDTYFMREPLEFWMTFALSDWLNDHKGLDQSVYGDT